MLIGIAGNFKQVHYQAPQVEKLLCSHGVKTLRLPGFSLRRFEVYKFKEMVDAINRCDVIYGISQNTNLRLWLVAKLLKKKTVNHWIGTDVLRTIDEKLSPRAKLSLRLIDYHIALIDWLQEELLSIGIESRIMPIVSTDISFERVSPPASHRVLVYLDEKRLEFYGWNIVFALANRFETIPFDVVGTDGACLPKRKNLVFRGWVSPLEMEEVYNNVSVLLRIPRHDGLSMMVLEALAKGKQVVYKYDFPHCFKAESIDEAEDCLKQIFSKAPVSNLSGHHYVLENYSKDRIAMSMIDFFSSVIDNV